MADLELDPEKLTDTMDWLDGVVHEFNDLRASYEKSQAEDWTENEVIAFYPPNYGETNGETATAIRDTERDLTNALDALHIAVNALNAIDEDTATTLNLTPEALQAYLDECLTRMEQGVRAGGTYTPIPDITNYTDD
ncbi:hypothetical protein [Actinobaculum sp. 313]|uniref:hypothetical protein n=1 Tax=Actinobaculum sp. 313 TaxID=2495645 RepID=UPI000D527F53|nr:hypothetical protein [Actinobaculum sp. 313]AWE43132.1 hypothetical protein DDD63_10690 [Actinobaculum sp. 313]